MASDRVRLVAGGDAVEIDASAGGRLVSLMAGGKERLVTSPPPEQGNPELRWGSFVMAPWVGRIRDATFAWDGTDVALDANFGRHAIHGLVFDRAWDVRPSAGGEVELRRMLEEAPWPFTGALVHQRIALEPGQLTQQIDVAAGESAMPVALGWHPWFRRPDGGDVEVCVDAARHLEVDADDIPTGRTVPVSGETDLRGMTALGERRLDHTYVRPDRTAVLAWPDLRLVMAFGSTVAAAVVHTPPEGVCVEPQTAWPDAVNLHAGGIGGTGLVGLPPGGRFGATVTWRWSVSQSPR